MGLDVHLYQFTDVDTDVILKLARLAEEPYNNKEFQKWKAMPPSERGDSFPSQQRKAEGYQKLVAGAQELGFPRKRFAEPGFGGKEISFPSKRHPEWPVGDWYSFGTLRDIMEQFTGHNIYSVFPEAKEVYGLFRPDWVASRKRLVDILKELQELSEEQKEDFREHFMIPHIPQYLRERWKNVSQASGTEIFASCLAQMEVMIETLDFVLNSGNPMEFLLYWSS